MAAPKRLFLTGRSKYVGPEGRSSGIRLNLSVSRGAAAATLLCGGDACGVVVPMESGDIGRPGFGAVKGCTLNCKANKVSKSVVSEQDFHGF